MNISSSVFIEKMTQYYKDTRTHAIAFWKLKALSEAGLNVYQPEHDSYYSVYDNMLFAYLSKDSKIHLSATDLNSFNCIALEETLFNSVADDIHGFDIHRGYKLHFDFSYTHANRSTDAYEIVAFDFNNPSHFEQASTMINQGEGDWMMPANIQKISREPVFDSSLWFFAKETRTGELVGIAISTYDLELKETDIEWFYVLPEYHKKGVGRFLIEETIKRSIQRSDDIRVGGTNEFYKKCGFVEKESNIWAAKECFSLIAPCIQPNILP